MPQSWPTKTRPTVVDSPGQYDGVVGPPSTTSLNLQSVARATSANIASFLLSGAPTDHDRGAFEQQVEDYEGELRAWLVGLEPALWARCSQLELT